MSDDASVSRRLERENESLRQRVAALEAERERWAADRCDLERVTASLRRREAYERLLFAISTLAAGAADVPRFQADCVAILGRGIGVSRAYLFEHRADTDTMDNTQEWCAEGVSPQIDNLQGTPSDEARWWIDTLRRGDTIRYADVGQIPDADTRQQLGAQSILSILAVPLFVGGHYRGFIGFDDCVQHREWPADDVEILLAISRIMAGVIERNEGEARLRAERNQLLSVFDSIDEPIYVADVRTYEVLFVNPALRRAVPRDPVGRLCYQEFQGLDAPCAFCTNDRLLAHPGECYRWEHANARLGRTFSIHDRLIAWPDGRQARLEFAIDITELKRLEQQLRESQKMQAIGSLAGGVAHDFNNLLSIILSCTSFALERVREGDPVYDDLVEVRKAGERAARLTGQLLAFSRRQVLEPQVLDLNRLVGDLEEMLRRLVGEQVEFSTALAPRLRPVGADPGQLEQVLVNLVVNAREAMPDGGTLTIETTVVEADPEMAARLDVPGGPYVRLAVRDTGCGMDAATQQRLFEPFFTTKGLGKGTGLGLSTVYGIVRQSGGGIIASSEPGRGSTFAVYLPALAGAGDAASPPALPVDRPAAGTETILVVEDEEGVRSVAERMLRRAGYQVLTAANGAEALRVCGEHLGAIQLLLTDVVLPQMSGRQLAERVQALRPGLPVLYMSGYTADAIGLHGVLERGTRFIGKPFNAADLRRKVREALDGDSPGRSRA